MERLSLKKEEQLDEYIREGKLKPALKLVESKQKKGDKSDSLLIHKIIILFSFSDGSRTQQAAKELESLISKKPHVTDHQALKRLDLFLAGRRDRDDFANNMWAVAGAGSKDEEFLSTWFHLKFDQERWEAAQKAAQTWQKAFPRNRTPFFLWILSLHIASIQPELQDVPRKLAQGLSFKLLAKATAEVPIQKGSKGESSSSPPRALNTEQDLLLLLEVYVAQRKYSDALAILEDHRTGFVSHLSQNRWQIVRYMIGLYELAGNWEGEWNVCSAILVNARPDIFDKVDDESTTYDFGELGDDWRVWDGLVTSCGMLSDSPHATNYINRTETIIEQFGKDKTSRNSDLANLKVNSAKPLAARSDEDRLLSLCKIYFEKYGSKAICFGDLRPHVSCLSHGHQRVLRQHFASQTAPSSDSDNATWQRFITRETNTLKFEYHSLSTQDDIASLQDALPAFVCDCLRLYRKSLEFDFQLPQSDRLPSDDAAILAAMALIRMYKLREAKPDWSYSLHRSISVLEFALRKSKHNYDILLILVRLYVHIGAGSLAIARYQQLSIKNIQNMTLPWMLYTRLSTLHPHPVTIDRDDGLRVTMDPFEETSNILTWFRRAYQLNRDSMEDFCSNNQWLMELDALETKAALQNSFCRLLLLAESSRIGRFRDLKDKHEESTPPIMRLSPKIKDVRDLTAFPNYEADGQPKFWELCQSLDELRVIRPNERWLGLNLRQALLWDRLSGKSPSIVNSSELIHFLQHYEKQVDTCSSAENTLFGICGLIYDGFEELDPHAAKGGSLANSVGQILLKVNKFNEEWSQPAERDEDPAGVRQGANLHAGFCALEVYQFVLKFVAVIQKLDRSESWMKKMLADLQTGCKELANSVSKQAAQDRDNIRSQGFFEKVQEKCTADDDVGGELNQLIDSKSWDGSIKMLVGSWKDALDGLLKTAATK